MLITNGTHTMRNILLALAAFGVISLSTSVIADEGAAQSVLQDTAEAVAPVIEPQPLSASDEAAPIAEAAIETKKVVHTHTHTRTRYRQPAKKQNAFQRLLELEKRKNAWLRRTFLGL